MYKFEIQIRGLIVFPKSRKLKRRGADFGKGTEIASRIFCRADCAAVIYEKIRRGKPIFFGKYGHEFLLNLYRIMRARKSYALREAPHVRVHGDPFHDAVCVAEYDVGGFARDSAERQDILHGVRDFPAEFFFDELRSEEHTSEL